MALINGTAGSNVLFGTPGADRIDGRGGNDQIYGRAGPDILRGGDGDDLLDGGADFSPVPKRTALGFTDELHGGRGRDVLHIGPGGYSNGDSDGDGDLTDDTKFADLTVVHQGGPSHEAARINQFDFRGHGGTGQVQDKFILASGADFDFDTWRFIAPRKIAADGSWSADLDLVRIRSEAGDVVLINPDDRHGRFEIHSDDGTWRDAVDDLMQTIHEEWSIA